MKYDYLIVGAGLSGCVIAERIASQLDKKCLIIERRNHIGGNCYDYYDENGILVHKYGPHIFHTTMKKVWDYLSEYTEWIPYFHRVLAVIEGNKVPIPFNFNTIEQLFSPKVASNFEAKLLDKYEYGKKIPILKLLETEDKDLKFLADYIYKNVFLGYNLKQWGLKPEELDGNVSGRVPVFLSRDDRYFQDQFQAIPKLGYTAMISKIINHKNISLLLNEDYKNVISDIKFDKLVFTGPIDLFFDYQLGQLPYRTLQFKFKNFEQEYYQETAQVNYPNNYDFTRITEYKHLTAQKASSTTVSFEYSEPFVPGINEPYYPIPRQENNLIYEKYKELADKETKNTYFVGRLADYKYYNMDQTVGVALQVFEKKIAKK